MKQTHLNNSPHISKPINHLFFQPKLSVNQPNDFYEQEADAVAEKVIQSKTIQQSETFFKPVSISSIQRKCADCEEEEKLQRKEENGNETEISESFEQYVDGLNNGGTSLPSDSKSFFESRIGYDFSNVKIHTNTVAAKSAQSINALAYTSGNNIVFNQNQFQPGTANGDKLIAHELTHVVQQNGSLQKKQIVQREPVPADQFIKFKDNFNPAIGRRLKANFADSTTGEVLGKSTLKRTKRRIDGNIFNTLEPLNQVCINGNFFLLEMDFGNLSGIINNRVKSNENEQIIPEIELHIKTAEQGRIGNFSFDASDQNPVWLDLYTDLIDDFAVTWHPNFQTLFQIPIGDATNVFIIADIIGPENDGFTFFEEFTITRCKTNLSCAERGLETGRYVIAPEDNSPIHPYTGSGIQVGEKYELFREFESDEYFICAAGKVFYYDINGKNLLRKNDLPAVQENPAK